MFLRAKGFLCIFLIYLIFFFPKRISWITGQCSKRYSSNGLRPAYPINSRWTSKTNRHPTSRWSASPHCTCAASGIVKQRYSLRGLGARRSHHHFSHCDATNGRQSRIEKRLRRTAYQSGTANPSKPFLFVSTAASIDRSRRRCDSYATQYWRPQFRTAP